MKRMLNVMLFVCLVTCLCACGKKEPAIETSLDFGELQETTIESTEDEFAITNKDVPGYEVRETTPQEIRDKQNEEYLIQVQEEYEKESEAILESESAEQVEHSVIVNNENVDVTTLEEEAWYNITERMAKNEYNSLDEVYAEIDNDYASYDNTVKEKVKELAEDNWEYWEQEYAKVENQKSPWTEEELAENPNLIYYTREEIEEMNAKMKEMGIEIR